MFLALLAAVQARASIGNSKNLDSLLSKTSFSLVLFQISHSPQCSKILTAFDRLCTRYDSKISMIAVDVSVSKDIVAKYSVQDAPSIGIFAGNRLVDFYTGGVTEVEISKFCDDLLSTKVTLIHNIFEFFRFQESKAPSSIVFSPAVSLDSAEAVMKTFIGIAHVGLITNENDATTLGIEFGQIYRPVDGMKFNISEINTDQISELISPLIQQINNPDTFGISKSPHTLVAVLDERDPLQKWETQKLFLSLREIYKSNISYQFCDFYRSPSINKQLGIQNYGNPMYVLVTRTEAKPKMTLFAHPSPSVSDFQDFLDEPVLGIKKDEPASGIPVLYARNFMSVALDPKRDVILLVAVPGMPGYTEAQAMVRNLISIFKPFRTIEFYEFNPRTQMVPGLQIPASDKPSLSIWPAHTESSGASFPATVTLKAAFENLMRLIKTRITPDRLRDLNQKVAELM